MAESHDASHKDSESAKKVIRSMEIIQKKWTEGLVQSL